MSKKEAFAQYCKTRMHPFADFTKLQKRVFDREEFWDQNGKNVFVQGHTSTGKTLIGFAMIWNLWKEGILPKVLYLIPYKAVAYQKYEEMCSFFPDLADDIIVSTGECREYDQIIQKGDAQIVIIIYEKIFLFSDLDPHFFRKWDLVVLDEFGIINSMERGIKTDFIVRRIQEQDCRMAVLATPFYDWSVYLQSGDFLEETYLERPVELEEYLVSQTSLIRPRCSWKVERIRTHMQKNGSFVNQYEDIAENDLPIHMVLEEMGYVGMLCQICCEHYRLGHNIILFLNDREGVRRTIKDLYRYFVENGVFTEPEPAETEDFFTEFLGDTETDSGDLYGLFEDEEDEDVLKKALYRGMTFHSAALSHRIRRAIEKGFCRKDACIQIIAATETLAYGINSSADVVIIYDIQKKNGTDKEILTQNEYKNYIGRAGRYGYSSKGYAYTMVRNKDLQVWKERMDASLPQLQSNIFKAGQEILPLYLLSMLRAGEAREEEEILDDMFGFPAAGTKDLETDKNQCREKIHTALETLTAYRFVKQEPFSERYLLRDLGQAIRGYILEIHKIGRLWAEVEKEHMFAFDFAYVMAECLPEKDIRSYVPKKAKHAGVVSALHYGAEKYLDTWEREGVISSERSEFVRKLFQPVYLDGTKRWGLNKEMEQAAMAFPLVRIAMMLTLQLEGYSLRDTYECIRMAMGINIKTMSNAAYFAEVASVLAGYRGNDEQNSELLRISLSLSYGGIPYRMLSFAEKNTFSGADREILIFIKRYYDLKKKNKRSKLEEYRFQSMRQKIYGLPEKYQVLMKNMEAQDDKKTR